MVSCWEGGQQMCTVLLEQVGVVVCQAKTCSQKGFRITLSFLKKKSSREHTRPPSLSFAVSMIHTMNARRFQRTHPLGGMGSSLNASKDIGVGVADVALACGSEQWLAQCVLQWLAQLALVAYLTQALLARNDLPNVRYVGETRWSSSEKDDDSISCTLIISAEQHERLLATSCQNRITDVLCFFPWRRRQLSV